MHARKPAIRSTFLLFLAVSLLFLQTGCAGGPSTPDPEAYRQSAPSEYFLYIPEGIKDDAKAPIFIGIHGQGGNGRHCWSDWQPYADQEGFILICPSLADEGGGWYQDEGEKKVANILNSFLKTHKANSKFYIAGFSAGAQFVQGFANRYAKNTAGVAILSAGNYYRPESGTRKISFLIVIGDQDNPQAVQAAKDHHNLLKVNKFKTQFNLLEGVNHSMTDQARTLTIEHFRAVMKK